MTQPKGCRAAILCRVLCATVAAALVSSCGPKKENVPVSDTLIDHPFQELDTTTMYYYNGGRLQWCLESTHMKKFIADTGTLSHTR